MSFLWVIGRQRVIPVILSNQLMIRITMAYPEESFAVLVRGCDERGPERTVSNGKQLNEEKVIPIGIGCPE